MGEKDVVKFPNGLSKNRQTIVAHSDRRKGVGSYKLLQ